jgi:hypothetical protein
MRHWIKCLAPLAICLLALAASETASAQSWGRHQARTPGSAIRTPGWRTNGGAGGVGGVGGESLLGSARATEGCMTDCQVVEPPCPDSCTPTPPPCVEACKPPEPPPCNTCNDRPRDVRSRSSANARASATVNVVVNTGAGARAGVSTYNNYWGGGGGGWFVDQGVQSMLGDIKVETAPEIIPFSAQRTLEKVIVVQAFCIDDRETPHPASQVTPDREIADTYDGELFRCLAGTRIQYVVAEYKGKVSFDGGQTTTCVKNSALYRSRDGKLECRPQKAARDCNERSLLRRYGAGIKILRILVVETYTAYKTVQDGRVIASSEAFSSTTAAEATPGFGAFGLR